MIKTGSKFFYATSAIAFVAAVVYAMATSDHGWGMDSLLGPLTLGYKGHVGDHVGYTLLISLAAASVFLGATMSGLRDADAEAAAQVAGLETVPEVEAPDSVNYWPVIGAFGAALVALGLAVDSGFFVLGAVVLAVTAVEWASHAWAARATGDPEVNRTIRNRVMRPFEVPLGSLLLVAILVIAVSRILLALPQISGYVVFGVVPVLVAGAGLMLISRPSVPQSAIVGMVAVGALALIGGGIVAAIAGERPHGSHDTHEEEPQDGEVGMAPLVEPSALVIQVGN